MDDADELIHTFLKKRKVKAGWYTSIEMAEGKMAVARKIGGFCKNNIGNPRLKSVVITSRQVQQTADGPRMFYHVVDISKQ